MRIQTALLLRLDTDHPRIFPRHPEMAVKWKHLLSVFMLVLSLYSLSISRVKKKKKRFMTHCFLKDAASSAVFQVVFG